MVRLAEEEGREDTDKAFLERIVADTLRRLGHSVAVRQPTVAEWLQKWLQSERGAIAAASYAKYDRTIRGFLESLGGRVSLPLGAITPEDVVAYRDGLTADGLSPRTVNFLVQLLARPFRVAVGEGLLTRSPVASVRPLRGHSAIKGTFTPEQIQKLLNVPSTEHSEWQGLILAGYFTGARLGDLSRLRWSAVDLVERTITFTQGKTGGAVKVPIHPDLEAWLRETQAAAAVAVFPTLSQTSLVGPKGLSATFARLVREAGIDGGLIRERHGKHGRSLAALTFHSLRHSFTTALVKAGIPAEQRMLLTGHADVKSHAIYSHHELQTLRSAIEKLPKLH
jgi:integrase